MSLSCLNIFNELNKSIDIANNQIINNMTDPSMQYDWACIKPNLTYDNYYNSIKMDWEQIVNSLINQPNKCTSNVGEIFDTYRHLDPDRIARARQIISALTSNDENTNIGLAGINIDELILDVIATSILKKDIDTYFEVTPNFIQTSKNLSKVLAENCQCQMIDIYKIVIKKYKKKYQNKIQGKSKDEVIELLRNNYRQFKEIFVDFGNNNIQPENKIIDTLSNKLTGLYGFSVESELNRLIPNELGSLKIFFVRVISEYFNNLHPIVWTQIFKGLTENIFVDLPFTTDEFFSYASKQLLLNSGPFILKILQTIRPVLTPELAQKYNLTKLTYPKLNPMQVELILSKVVYNWPMYKILDNFSASVGHVAKVVRVDDPQHIFIIKIIKPLSIAQSCWEYQTLHNIFPPGTCEQAFIKNMLESNGREMNVRNEINNIDRGYRYYTCDYNEIYSIDINAMLTTVQNIENIIHPYSWFALAMTLAPGIPLSKLIETNDYQHLINNDTKYRAKLHRCLDLLVFKFFSNIISNGFYHGDLHSGNIFFSYEQNRMTLIDFGAVGEINLYEDDPDIKTLLDIIIMSVYSNYDEMLDVMTILLNSKCTETQIDMNSLDYKQLKNKLLNYRLQNIRNEEIDAQQREIYKNNIFSDERIQQEKNDDINIIHTQYNIDSIYSYLEIQPKNKSNVVVENSDILPKLVDTSVKSNWIGFDQVLTEIITFYAISGVNIAIKLSEFYELQKAYILLLGVLAKVNYDDYRTSIALNKAIVNIKNLSQLKHLSTVIYLTKSYNKERKKHKKLKEIINNNSVVYDQPNFNIANNNELWMLIEREMQAINEMENMEDLDNDNDIDTNINTNIKGGGCGCNKSYYLKYLKYKSKYNNELSKINQM